MPNSDQSVQASHGRTKSCSITSFAATLRRVADNVSVNGVLFTGILAFVVLTGRPATAVGQICSGMQDIGGFAISPIFVSSNGSAVAGTVLDQQFVRAVRWTQATGAQDLGSLGVYSFSRAISADGSTVVGLSAVFICNEDGCDPECDPTCETNCDPCPPAILHAFRWTPATGMQSLGTLGGLRSNALAVSADGSVVVGESEPAPMTQALAFRWSSGGMQNLGTLGGSGSAAYDVSADGSVVVGSSQTAAGESRAFRWTAASGMLDLGTIDARPNEASLVSADGSTVVGTLFYPGGTRVFRWTAASGMQDITGVISSAMSVSTDGRVVSGIGPAGAFRWTALTGVQNLNVQNAVDISAEGSVVVGNFVAPSGQDHAFRWTAADGIQDLGSLGGGISVAAAVSADGTNVVGTSVNAAGQTRVFRWGDADNDGLLDDWECNGIPYTDALGVPRRFILDSTGDGVSDADWQHKDLFVEVDAMAGMMISNQAQEMIIQAFFDAPVSNPDGIPGIVLHLQVSDVNLVSNSPWTVVPGTNGWVAEFDPLKTAHFGTGSVEHRKAKGRAFRYAICADRIDDGSLGTAELPGNDFFITLGENPVAPTVELEAGTFMHELGHTLGLRHGGGDSINGKPNYVSVMNYALTEPLGFSQPFWTLDFSREKLATLHEASLSEPAGIPSVLYSNVIMPFGITSPLIGGRSIRYVALAGIPTDWNNDGVATSASIVQDLNYLGNGAPFASVGSPTPSQPLIGHDDWANIQLAIGTTGDFADFVHQTPPRDEVTGAFAAWRRQNLTGPEPTCDSIDFNNDTSLFDPQDIEAFLSVYSEGPCVPETATCNDIDFNNDTSLFDPCDISSFLTMYSEGPCTPCGP